MKWTLHNLVPISNVQVAKTVQSTVFGYQKSSFCRKTKIPYNAIFTISLSTETKNKLQTVLFYQMQYISHQMVPCSYVKVAKKVQRLLFVQKTFQFSESIKYPKMPFFKILWSVNTKVCRLKIFCQWPKRFAEWCYIGHFAVKKLL